MSNVLHFIKYNNLIPIVLGFVFLGAGGVYAANNPESIYDETKTIISIDNTYIATKDFGDWTPVVEITDVTEDDVFYYISFDFTTIGLEDAVWQDLVIEEQMKVSKEDLGEYRDLGVYVTQQLRQIIDRELARLKETQEFEKRLVTRKQVATAYSGLIGGFLDDSTEMLPGYEPVVAGPEASGPLTFSEPAPQSEPVAATIIEEESVVDDNTVDATTTETENVATTSDTNSDTVTDPDTDSGAGDTDETSEPTDGTLTLQILGDNPAHVLVGNVYEDLGVVATNDTNAAVMVAVFVNDEPVSIVSIDTSTSSTWVVRYVTNDGISTSTAERIVEVYEEDQTEDDPEETDEPTATSTASATEETATSTEPDSEDLATTTPGTPEDEGETGTTTATTSEASDGFEGDEPPADTDHSETGEVSGAEDTPEVEDDSPAEDSVPEEDMVVPEAETASSS